MELFRCNYNDTSFWHHRCKSYPIGGDPYFLDVGNVFVPAEFDHMFFLHGTPVPHDPGNDVGYAQPEGHHESVAQFPDRVYEGFAAWMDFGFYRIINSGLSKTVTVPAKGKLRITSYNHAWSSTDDDPRTSDDVGDSAFAEPATTPGLTDAQRNATFYVGVGDNPFSTTQKSVGMHIYNHYAMVQAEFDVEAGECSVFTMGEFLYPFKHCNAYFDEFVVEFIEDETPVPPEPCWGYPREQYKRSYLLMHPTADAAWVQAVLDSGAWDNLRLTIGGSADDAGLGALDYRKVLAVRPQDWPSDLGAFFAEYYPGVMFVPIDVETPDELHDWLVEWMNDPNPTPPPSGGSQSPLPPGLHLTGGNDGASFYFENLKLDLSDDDVWPAVKAFGLSDVMLTLKLFKDIDPRIHTMGRVEKTSSGHSLESINLEGDLWQNAVDYMSRAMPEWEPHRDYVDIWELINEQDCANDDYATRLGTIMLYCAQIADQNGYKVGGFGFSLGNPEWSHMQRIAETGCLSYYKANGHALTVHEYDRPLWKNMGQPIPGRPAQPDRGSIAFRYRFWEDAVGGPENMPDVYVTELATENGLIDLSRDDFRENIEWYHTEASKDIYVKGTHWFSWGSPGGAWEEYDIHRHNYADIWYDTVLKINEDCLLPSNVTPYSQRNPEWKDDQIGTTSFTIGSAGCAMVSSDMIATQVEPSLDPKELNSWLNANNGYTIDGRLIWSKVAERVDGMEFSNYHIWRDGSGADLSIIEAALQRGPCALQVDFYPDGSLDSHFVVGYCYHENDIDIIDPWTGEYGSLMEIFGINNDLAQSVFALAEYAIDEPVNTEPLIGFNDHPGPNGTAEQWMIDNQLPGLVVRPIFLGGSGSTLNFTAAEAAGIRVIVNLRYSWSVDQGGGGTIPKPYSQEWYEFIQAATYTINTSLGVWGWELFNEFNNPREWPLNTILTPEDVYNTYNAIRANVLNTKRMAIGALDPFNAAAGNPATWLTMVHDGITGAEFVTAHGYIRGPDASKVDSPEKFADAPLQWQYLNYSGCATELLTYLPDKYSDRAVYITEFNHLYKTQEPDWGWVQDNRAYDVVFAAHDAAIAAGFAGLALYRWSGDEWHVWDNEYVKDAFIDILTT